MKDTRSLQARVAACLEKTVAADRLVGGVVLVARDREPVVEAVAGFADKEAGRRMTRDTIFRYSSLTKPIVAATAMVLVERGMVHLDDPVTRWLPTFRPKLANGEEPRIQIRQLLTHTAGLTYRLSQPPGGSYEKAGVSDGLDEPGLSMSEELGRLVSVPLTYSPGTAWDYSLAYDLLGEVIARAANMSLPEAVSSFVTRPLGMRDTTFRVVDPARLAAAYVSGPPPHVMNDPEVIPFVPGTAGIRYSPSRIFNSDSFASGGAGIAGTAPDFLTFLEALRSGGAPILKSTTVGQMSSNQIGELRITTEQNRGWGFGFGGAVLMDPQLAGTPQGIGTWKWGGVYGHHWYVDPVNRLTVLAMTNTALEGMIGGFVGELMAAVYGVGST